jgi:hypothetical protein
MRRLILLAAVAATLAPAATADAAPSAKLRSLGSPPAAAVTPGTTITLAGA